MAAICYSKLNLCLLAIEQRKYEGGDIFINPKNKVINPNAIGKLSFFALWILVISSKHVEFLNLHGLERKFWQKFR